MNSKKNNRFAALLGTIVVAVLIAGIGVGTLAAQTTGTILGNVRDQTDAVIPGATIYVTQVETGTVRTTVSGNSGNYRLPALAVGTYQIRAEADGFQTEVRSGVTLTIGREAVVNFALQVGNVAEQVTVTGEAPLIETTSASVSGVVDSQQMRDIPLNSRSFLELVPLQTNAVFAEAGASSASKGFGRKISIAGTRYHQNLFLLDGAVLNDISGVAGSAAGTMAGVETVREFQVISNAFDAEHGRHTGGVISAVTKSGTNQFHGSLFEFIRNDNMDAPRWEDNAFAGGVKPEFRRNQFGAAVGGPIVQDRTFFFGSYEGLRQLRGNTTTYNVPSLDSRNGIFQGDFIGVDPTVKPFLDAYPLPNGTEDATRGRARFTKSTDQTTDQDYITARVDHRFSDSSSLFGRFTYDEAEVTQPNMSILNVAKTPNRFATLEETHIFSPVLLSKTHFSFNRTNLTLFDGELDGINYSVFSFDGSDVPGRMSVTNLTTWGGGSTNPKFHIQNNFQFKQDFYYTSGRHSIKFGGQFERFQFNQVSKFHGGGTFYFGGVDDFMMNRVDTASFIQPDSDAIRGWRQNLVGFYIQDDIALRPGFTLNLGLRYEFISVSKEVNGKVANIRDTRPAHLYTVTPQTTDVGDPYFKNPSLKNFAPRIGFAWDPFQTGRSSVRGGVGLFHDQLIGYGLVGTSGVRAAPFFSVAELFADDFIDEGGLDFPDAYYTQVRQAAGTKPQIDLFDYEAEQPYVLKWNLDIEREIAAGTTIETGYSGTRGVHLPRGNVLLNTKPVVNTDDGRRLILIHEPLPNPHFNRMRTRITDGTSYYHAWRFSLNKRFSNSFQFQSSYTFSKSIDDSSTWTGSSDFREADRNGYRTEKDNGLSAFDVRHSWTTNAIVDLPGSNLTGGAGALFGGWSLSSIIRFNSGHPLTLNQDRVRAGRVRSRYVDGPTLDLAPGGDQRAVNPQNPDQYYDPANYAPPEPFYMGTIGKNHIIVPGIANVDFTLMKNTAIGALGESGSLQFRAEFFNLFNRSNFDIPEERVYDRRGRLNSDAGRIFNTRDSSPSRQIQFALKLIF